MPARGGSASDNEERGNRGRCKCGHRGSEHAAWPGCRGDACGECSCGEYRAAATHDGLTIELDLRDRAVVWKGAERARARARSSLAFAADALLAELRELVAGRAELAWIVAELPAADELAAALDESRAAARLAEAAAASEGAARLAERVAIAAPFGPACELDPADPCGSCPSCRHRAGGRS